MANINEKACKHVADKRGITLDLSEARRVIYGLDPPRKDGFATYYDFVGTPTDESSGHQREGTDYSSFPVTREVPEVSRARKNSD